MTWTNFEPYGTTGDLGSVYQWKGVKVENSDSGVGCAAFGFLLSGAAFDKLPARAMDKGNFTFGDIKTGNILRVNGNSHLVIVLQKSVGGGRIVLFFGQRNHDLANLNVEVLPPKSHRSPSKIQTIRVVPCSA